LDNHTGIVLDDVQSMFGSMPNLHKLTLNIRDTRDPTFCHGSIFESMLIEHLPHLQKFDYTMTHRMSEKTLVENFLRYSMNNVYYGHDDVEWIHIYSLPWPSHREDKREIPVVNGNYHLSVTSDVQSMEYINDVHITKENDMLEMSKRFRAIRQLRTCLPIEIKLPRRISKLILSKETRKHLFSDFFVKSINFFYS
jgi:hypothetical protein